MSKEKQKQTFHQWDMTLVIYKAPSCDTWRVAAAFFMEAEAEEYFQKQKSALPTYTWVKLAGYRGIFIDPEI